MQARRVWFHRRYERLTGGHVKHSHYYGHVARLPGHARRMVFSEDRGDLAERAELWPTASEERVEKWDPVARDILFLAGTDWRYHDELRLDALDVPRINLIQHVRHAHAGTELHGYLGKRAVRICVSGEVASAIRETGRVNGPITTIPNGTDCLPWPGAQRRAPFDERAHAITVVGYKRPDLAKALSARLDQRGIPHFTLASFLDRDAFLGLLAETRVAVCLPRAEEGFYLPALEAMAAGCTVVTLDCVGNRGFCRHDRNCLVARDDQDALAATVVAAAELHTSVRARLHAGAEATVGAHSLEAECTRFHDVLRDIDRLWTGGATVPSASSSGGRTPRRSGRAVDFMVIGAQKCGTTALAHFLSQHPEIAMPAREGHLFDSPDYSDAWSRADIDKRYRRRIDPSAGETVCGESTPLYLYLDDVPAALRSYNPDLKVIVILRDPVERAISHYAMERARGNERLPLWLGLLAEPGRLRRCQNPRAPGSAARRHSYRSRGVYSRQLRNVFRSFPRDNVLIVRSEDLLAHHDEVLAEVFSFLGVSVSVSIPPEIVFKGEDGRRHALARAMLKVSYLAESRRLRRLLGAGP